MQLEVSPYLLVDTLRDWLVVQITSTAGVNVYRAKTRDKAEPHYEAIKASGSYHMLALMNEDGECIASEHKPRIENKSWAKEVVRSEPPRIPDRWKEPVSRDPATQAQGAALIVASELAKPGGIVETAKAIEEKRVDLSGFTTGLPSGFKTGK